MGRRQHSAAPAGTEPKLVDQQLVPDLDRRDADQERNMMAMGKLELLTAALWLIKMRQLANP